ncbi:hypothetical protein G7Y89_g13113 [Cudoniella acicularis]|uniref:Lysophospholipase n=1 Tax=Cudoniella acicularis TaxID=354080 RepID=A0A8H4R7H7_9HELO|nr:hypothetical protein G7Y89_g13113 [Cudoniella acicularis]
MAHDVFSDKQIAAKHQAGFNISVADYLGRIFGYEFIPGPVGGLGITFSSAINQTKFIDHETPFPIIQYNEIDTFDPVFFDLQFPTGNATIYDITPFEFGAWSGSIGAFTPTEWLGTSLSGGVPVNESACVRGFDRAGFLIGTSADTFDAWYIQALSNGTEAQFAKRSSGAGNRIDGTDRSAKRQSAAMDELLQIIPESFSKVFGLNITSSSYAVFPNPFANLSSTSSVVNHSKDLRLVDGSESGQAIPLWGLIQPARGLEFIIAWDDNEDAAPYQWNNGTNLYNSYLAANASKISFLIVLPAVTFVNKNFTHKPVFFGCDPLLTTTRDANGPIILYFADASYSAYTNYSYSQSNRSNRTLDPDWPVCLGCAAIDRSLSKGLGRMNEVVP